MALEYALLQTVRYRYMGHATVKTKHPSVRGEPVAALHVFGRPRKQQLAEAQTRDKHVGLVDLAGLQVDPFEWITGVINFHPFCGIKLSSRDRGMSILREFTIELLPKVGIGRQMLGLFLPDEFQSTDTLHTLPARTKLR